MLQKSDISAAIGVAEDASFVIGEQVLIRTVTFSATGRVDRISNVGPTYFLHLSDAAWIADVGRFMDTLKTGQANEIEPAASGMRVSVASIVDVMPWDHPLPRKQK